MRLSTRTAATVSVAASLVGLVGFSPSASASSSGSSEGTYCSVVVERVKPGEKVSRVKSRTCSDDRTTAATMSSSAGTLLITWYQHAGYGGGMTHVYGDYGPCDRSGYVLDAGMSRYMISSFETYNSCDGQMAALNDDPNPVYYYGYATEYVGDRANDNIGYIKVWDAL
ncbi:hypothetical protein DKG34_37755 [Streptomyces sp. NWU49]|uniref:Predicted protein n=1 Tax=Streptomyces viridosporus (strain ATCC 14672 / DSM 40746 / JCM 4963 / KCTC 9882 / NRRL B-12104 / FH 1290) TaxID=566461 RepID=D6AA18_STRV1|nr:MULTISPECIES: hypothetical protein [Streptomyces]EFE72113.1 predicted protein [Streptomyces viridosporus ATCC 14672]PWJ02556.1 hypothetical protein DKG34_37755 [Streptomyces sp. NWU49]